MRVQWRRRVTVLVLLSLVAAGLAPATAGAQTEPQINVRAVTSQFEGAAAEPGAQGQGWPFRASDEPGAPGYAARLDGWVRAMVSPGSGGGYQVGAPGGLLQFIPLGAAEVPGELDGGQVVFRGVWPDTDLHLRAEANRLKEEIVLQRPPATAQWQFALRTSGLTPEVGDDGVIRFPQKHPGRPSLEIGGLVAVDAAGAQAPVQAALAPAHGNSAAQYTITLSVDPAWLQDPARRYPVVVDPTVTLVYSGSPWDQHDRKVFELSDGTLIVALIHEKRFRVSKDGGQTWLTPTNDSLRPTGWAGDFMNVDIKPDGTVYVAAQQYNTGSNCSYDKENIFYYRGQLAADRMSVTSWSSPYTVWSYTGYCWRTYAFYPDISVYDAGTYTYVHITWAYTYWSSTWTTFTDYVKYRRLRITDSTGSVYAYTTSTPTSTTNGGYVNNTKVVANKLAGHMILAYSKYPNADAWAADHYYSLNRWTGTAYYSSTHGTQYTWLIQPEYSAYTYQISYDAAGRFQVMMDAPYLGREVTASTGSYVTFSDPNCCQPATGTVDSSNIWWLIYRSGNNLNLRTWDRPSNTWGPVTTVLSPAPGSAQYPVARIGPPFDHIDLVWGSSTYFTRLYFDPPGPSNLSPTGGVWVPTETPALTWSFSDPNAGDTQSAFRVQIKDSVGTVIHDSGKVTSTVSSYTVPAGVLTSSTVSYAWNVQVWDNVGIASAVSTDSQFRVDGIPPNGSVEINGGNSFTNQTSVYLALAAADDVSGVDQMRFSDDGINWGAWEPFAANKWYMLPAGDGPKAVYVQYSDQAGGISASYSDTITLDSTRPTVVLTINTGAAETVNAGVALQIDAANNPLEMRFRNESDANWTAWEPYTTTRAWTLTSGWGPRTVYVEVTDRGGTTGTASDSIELKFEPPTNLRAWAEVDHTYLQWDASVSSATVGYNVYGSTTSGSGYSLRNSTPVTTLDCRDYAVTLGTRYYYIVKSVDSLGRESPTSSNEVTIVAGTYPVGTLQVTPGSTSGPGGNLSLTARSASAVQWTGIEWRVQGAATWNVQTGSGPVTPDVPFTVNWTVPSAANPYEVRVKLEDDQLRAGQTETLLLTLPARPAITRVDTDGEGNVAVEWTGNGQTYDLERSTDHTFPTALMEKLATGTTATRMDMPFNGVANPSFEVTDTLGFPLRWSKLGSGTYALNTAERYEGGTSLQIGRTLAPGEDGVTQTLFEGPGLVGKAVTASAWVKLDAVAGTGFVVRLRFQDRSGTDLDVSTSAALQGTAGWQHAAVTGWAPDNTYRVMLEYALVDATGTAWLDAAQAQAGLSARGDFQPGLVSDVGYYRVRAWSGPLYNESVPTRRAVAPFPTMPGRWAWAQ